MTVLVRPSPRPEENKPQLALRIRIWPAAKTSIVDTSPKGACRDVAAPLPLATPARESPFDDSKVRLQPLGPELLIAKLRRHMAQARKERKGKPR
jgi:hypothetical protein